MKIAVTYDDDGTVFQHFGHTEKFKIYDIADFKVADTEVVTADGFGHESLAEFLIENGVQVLMCGGIGYGAQMALVYNGIELLSGVSGNADQAIQDLLDGTLQFGTGSNCSHHGEGGCGEHECGNHGCGGHECGI